MSLEVSIPLVERRLLVSAKVQGLSVLNSAIQGLQLVHVLHPGCQKVWVPFMIDYLERAEGAPEDAWLSICSRVRAVVDEALAEQVMRRPQGILSEARGVLKLYRRLGSKEMAPQFTRACESLLNRTLKILKQRAVDHPYAYRGATDRFQMDLVRAGIYQLPLPYNIR